MPQVRIARAGFFRRAVALAIDLIVMGILYAIVGTLFGLTNQAPGDADANRLAEAIESVIVLAYTSTEVFFAATPGKMLLRMRIGHTRGMPADAWTRILRWSTKQGPWLAMAEGVLLPHPVFRILSGFMSLVLACGAFAAANDDHLAWYDQWSGTAVWRIRRARLAQNAAMS